MKLFTSTSTENKIGKLRRTFLIAAAVILLFTGLAKLFTLTGDTTLLEVSDPIFRVPFKTLMLMVGLAELGIAVLCLFSKWEKIAVVLVAWIASGFLLYRMGIRMVDWRRPCGCLGNLTDVIGLSPQAAETVSIALLTILLAGSYAFLLIQFINRPLSAQAMQRPRVPTIVK